MKQIIYNYDTSGTHTKKKKPSDKGFQKKGAVQHNSMINPLKKLWHLIFCKLMWAITGDKNLSEVKLSFEESNEGESPQQTVKQSSLLANEATAMCEEVQVDTPNKVVGQVQWPYLPIHAL